MTIPRNLSKLAPGANTSGVLAATNGGTGLTTPGDSGNILTSNGSAWVSSAPAAGTLQAVASGSLANGDKVVVNSDGTVSVVQTVVDPTPSIGTQSALFAGNPLYMGSAYDSASNKIVISFRNDSYPADGYAVVGTISGTSISFGTAVQFTASIVADTAIAYDGNAQKIVIGYKNFGNNQYGTAIIGTVSGTTISFGTPVVFNSSETNSIAIAYDSNSQKLVFTYNGTSFYGKAIVGTISGTSISFGTAVTFRSAASWYMKIAYASNAQKIVITFNTADVGGDLYAIVGTVSGTSISFGTAVMFYSTATATAAPIGYDANAQRIVIAYPGSSSYGTAVIGTVSGTSISFGTPVVFNSASTGPSSVGYDSNATKTVITYTDAGNSSYGTAIVGTVSGTSVSFGSEAVFKSASTNSAIATYCSSEQKFAIPYNSGGGYAVTFATQSQSTNLTSENYIGISNAVYSNGQTATVQIVGSIDDAQSGLTAGQAYYVQSDGTLSTTPGTPSVFAGTAVSTTKLIVKG